MSLTPEERHRIYEEEKARLEAQKKLRANARHSPLKTFAVILVVITVLVVVASQAGKHPPSATSSSISTGESQQQHKSKLLIRLTKYQYNDFAHWIEVEGTVKNVGESQVFSPEIIGEAYSKDGTLLGQSSAWPEGQMLSKMAPGVSAGFSMLIPVKGGTIAKAGVYTKSAEYEVIYPK